jgi:hypothetical protein
MHRKELRTLHYLTSTCTMLIGETYWHSGIRTPYTNITKHTHANVANLLLLKISCHIQRHPIPCKNVSTMYKHSCIYLTAFANVHDCALLHTNPSKYTTENKNMVQFLDHCTRHQLLCSWSFTPAQESCLASRYAIKSQTCFLACFRKPWTRHSNMASATYPALRGFHCGRQIQS